MTPRQIQYEAAKRKRDKRHQGMLKGEYSENKRLKLREEKNSKEESSAFTYIHCGKNNYECPQEMGISYGESGEANNDTGAVKADDGENDRMQPHMPVEIDPFTESLHNAKLPKTIRMPSNIQPYDGSEYPADHVIIFQMTARVYNWDTTTQCRMFKLTLRGAARVCLKRHKDRDKKIRCSKNRRNGSIEDFTRRFLTESRRAKKMPKAVKITKFIKKVSDPGLTEYLHREEPESMEEVARITRAYCRAEEAVKNLKQ
ncbi:reverse transcriptase domain-containing protein [Artemisia annua]|uniref:Reverse transcriptase domain-containing protein n=1 Tax=Artemisia annua TaxID=35608 RepID=A0A2U1QJH3_ARTAN|nr:reverse transcriptase domain-containing protein [Artemisia annua]